MSTLATLCTVVARAKRKSLDGVGGGDSPDAPRDLIRRREVKKPALTTTKYSAAMTRPTPSTILRAASELSQLSVRTCDVLISV